MQTWSHDTENLKMRESHFLPSYFPISYLQRQNTGHKQMRQSNKDALLWKTHWSRSRFYPAPPQWELCSDISCAHKLLSVATTGAGPDLVCAWRKAQGRDKEGWKQVPVQSCKRNPSLPSQQALQNRYKALGMTEDVNSEIGEKEPAPAFSGRSDQPTPRNKICIKTICQEETTASYGHPWLSPVWNRSTHLQTRTSF